MDPVRSKQLEFNRTLFRKFCPAKEGVISVLFQDKILSIKNNGYTHCNCFMIRMEKKAVPLEISAQSNERQNAAEYDQILLLDEVNSQQEHTQGVFFNFRKLDPDKAGVSSPKKSFNFRGVDALAVVDPKGRLNELIEKGDLLGFQGNDTIENSQIYFIDDPNHTDKSLASIRGELFNRLKTPGKIVCLCEAMDAETFSFSPKEKAYYFPPNLDETNAEVYFSGWDDKSLVKKTLQTARQIGILINDPAYVALSEAEKDKMLEELKNVLFNTSHLRTEIMWRSINKYLSLFPDAKIFIFAGAAHNNEAWLQEKLLESGYRYCILTTKNPNANSSEEFNKYYHINDYDMWGKKK